METVDTKIYFDLGAGWTENKDVLQHPPLTWESGIRGNTPTDLLASTGISTFYLDNSYSNNAGIPGLYSPDHDDCLSGFGESTEVKIEVGYNEALNPGFETAGAGGADIWADWVEINTPILETDDPHSGKQAVKLTRTTGNGILRQVFTVVPGTEYTLTFWTRCDGTNDIRYSLWDDTNSAYIVAEVDTGVLETEWTEFTSDKFTVPATCVTMNLNIVRPGTGDPGTGWVDDVSLMAVKTRFYGRIVAIRPTAGLFEEPVVEIEAHDWMGYLSGQELGKQTVVSDQRVDDAITIVMSGFPIQPSGIYLASGIETFPLMFNTDSPESSMASFFQKMCRNELGRIYVTGSGILTFENRNTRALNTTNAFTISGTMTELQAQYINTDVKNIIQARVSPLTASDDNNVLLWDLKVGEYFGGIIPSIAAGETLVLTCPFTDPAIGSAISAIDLVDPIEVIEFGSVADYEKNDMITDLDWSQEIGANVTVVSMTNEHATNTGYLNDLQIYGRALISYGPMAVLEARDQTSISGVGEHRFLLKLDQVGVNRAQAYVDHILSQVKDPHLRPVRIRVLANQSSELLAGLNTAEVSTRFTVAENVTGIDGDFFVNWLKYTQAGGQLWVDIIAGPSATYSGVLA